MRLKTAPMYGGPGGRYEFNRNTSWINSALTNGTGGAHYAQFLLGVPNLVTLRDSLFTYYYGWKSVAAFVQNDWKLTPDFTLNLGMRYTLQYPRSVSTFDVRHAFSGTFLWDLPVGRGRQFLPNMAGWMDHIIGGWTLSGSGRAQQGTPLVVVIRDGNQLAAGNLRAIRPNLVPGVSLKNPLWSRQCPIGTTCEPWFNPAAFTRPVKGELGNAPRTIDGARWPSIYLFDLSVQKNWQLREAKRLQLRVDAINAFNHPIFQFGRDSDNGEIFAAPSEAVISNSEYDAWVNFSPSSRPARSTPSGAALLAQINAQIRSYNINPAGQAAAMVLPRDFFVKQVPEGFHSMNLNSFDITSIEQLKLYRLKQAYTPDRSGYLAVTRGAGSLASLYTPRFLQFALKLYF